VTPQVAALALWLLCGCANCTFTGVMILAAPDALPEKKNALDVHGAYGAWPFAVGAAVLLFMGPMGLGLSIYKIGSGLWSYARARAESLRGVRALDKRIRKLALEAAARVEKSSYARCPSCTRLIVLDTTASLPRFTLHQDITYASPCPGSGKNHMGAVVRGAELGVTMEEP
jgi:hypothetical protein